MELSFTTVMFLEFYLFYVFLGERVIGWVRAGGTKHYISFEGGGGIKYFPTLFGGGGQILWQYFEINSTLYDIYTYFMTGPLLEVDQTN